MKNLICLILLAFVFSSVYSQNDSVYKYTLPELKITQIENGKDVIYEFDNEENLFLVNDSQLVANPQKYKYAVNVADIKNITIIKSKNLVPVMVFSFAIGGLLGSGGLRLEGEPTVREWILG